MTSSNDNVRRDAFFDPRHIGDVGYSGLTSRMNVLPPGYDGSDTPHQPTFWESLFEALKRRFCTRV